MNKHLPIMKIKSPKKEVFACCRLSCGMPIPYAICSTEDIAQQTVDKLTLKFDATFIIIPFPIDPDIRQCQSATAVIL
jgi:hypothetical protein